MKISVCIASVRATTLQVAIDSIIRQTWTDWELILITQGNSGIQQVGVEAQKQDSRIRAVHLDWANLSNARNVGIARAEGDIIAFTDDDCEAQADWLEVLAGYFENEPETSLVGGSLIAPASNRRGLSTCPSWQPVESFYDPKLHHHAPSGCDWIGGNFALRRNTAERVGKFDIHLGAGAAFQAADDTDYKLRMEAAGLRFRATPRAVVFHTNGRRYGLKAVLRNSRNYARGNAALAAKLTLQGDQRGQEWIGLVKSQYYWNWWRQKRPYHLPFDLLRLRFYLGAYKECLSNYRVDKANLLYPKETVRRADKMMTGAKPG